MPASLLDEPEVLLIPDEIELSEGNGGGGGPVDEDPGGRWGDGGGDDEDDAPAGIYRVGIWAGMTAIATFFITLSVAYVLRARVPKHWMPVDLPHLLWASTAIILISSFTCEASRRALRDRRENAYRTWLAVTLLLGLGFLTTQALAWRQLARQGVFLLENPHSSFFYLFTFAHAVHLAGGILALFYLLLRAVLPFWRRQKLARRREASDVVTFYWHFMDGIWIGLFSLLLLVG